MKRPIATLARGRDARQGFTLIELLVVLAMISLLVAILLPSLGLAKARTKLLVCTRNLKAIGEAWIHDYLPENDGRFFQRTNANWNYGGWRGLDDIKGLWPRPLNPYLLGKDADDVTESTAKLFSCPADRGKTPDAYYLHKSYRAKGTSYQTNVFLISSGRYTWFSDRTEELDRAIASMLPGLTLGKVTKRHKSLVLMGEFNWVHQWDPRPPDPNLLPDWHGDWHGKQDYYNVVFLDGHTEYREIPRGIYVDRQYRVLPFESLDGLARKVQDLVP